MYQIGPLKFLLQIYFSMYFLRAHIHPDPGATPPGVGAGKLSVIQERRVQLPNRRGCIEISSRNGREGGMLQAGKSSIEDEILQERRDFPWE